MKASIIIPVLNEVKFIERCVESIIDHVKENHGIEILIIDGGSSDGSIELIDKLSQNFPKIRAFHNKNRIQASALNIGIKESTGEYIIRLDAHSEYSAEYIKNCIATLDNSSEDIANVGGAITTKPGSSSLIAKTISYVLMHKLGVGNSTFRTENIIQEKFVETVPFGCFRRSATDSIGLFNEDLARGEDLEFNKRLLNSGRKILISPDIHSIYYSRPDLLSFIKQAFSNGFYITNKINLKIVFHKLRHFVPLFFIFYIFLTLILIFTNYSEPFTIIEKALLFVLLFYICIGLLLGVTFTIKERSLSYLVLAPITLITLHLSYGAGSFFGLFSNLLKK